MVTQEDEIRARDRAAEGYDAWYAQKGAFYNWIEKKSLIDALDLSYSDVVLDAGCGTGRFTREIAKRCKKVYGVDFSPVSIEVLNKKLQERGILNVKTSVCDITKALPLKEQVDKIVSVQVIQHIPTEAGRRKALDNFYNNLQVGGVCVISVYNYSSLFGKGLSKEGRAPNGIYYSRFTPNEVEALLKRIGFKNVSVTGCINLSYYGLSNKDSVYWVFHPFAKLDVFLSRFRLSQHLGAFLIGKGIK